MTDNKQKSIAQSPKAEVRNPKSDSGPQTTGSNRTSDLGPRTSDLGFIPYGKQDINQTDIDSVIEVLKSDFLTQGPKVPEFEKAVANYCGAGHAVAANSATSALHLACRALNLSPGDALWTSPISFVASANCALYCGANIDFVDINPRTYNMSPEALEIKLHEAKKSGKLPKIVVPVHMCGQSCDVQAIHSLSLKYGFHIIEDASHAIGGQYKNDPIGSCRYSDITIFSFHPVKIITTGEGGMALTNQVELAERMRLLRSHGITREISEDGKIRAQRLERHRGHKSSQSFNTSTLQHFNSSTSQPFNSSTSQPFNSSTNQPPGWYYEQIDLGYNYRMTDIQAALGISQINRLDEFVARRKELAKRYDRLLAGLPVTIPWQHTDSSSAWHLYVIRLDIEKASPDRRQVFEYMRNNAIGVNVHYIPVHTQPYYQAMGFAWGMFPEAEKYSQAALTLPLFPTMRERDQDRVVEVLKSVVRIS